MTKEKEKIYQLCIAYFRRSCEAFQRGDAQQGYKMYLKAKEQEGKL